MYQWHLTPGGVNLKTNFDFLETLPCKMISTAITFLDDGVSLEHVNTLKIKVWVYLEMAFWIGASNNAAAAVTTEDDVDDDA